MKTRQERIWRGFQSNIIPAFLQPTVIRITSDSKCDGRDYDDYSYLGMISITCSPSPSAGIHHRAHTPPPLTSNEPQLYVSDNCCCSENSMPQMIFLGNGWLQKEILEKN